MSASPGNSVMTPAERQQRRRAKLIDPAALEAKDIARRILEAVSPEKAELTAAMLNHRIGRNLFATAALPAAPGADYPRMLYHPDGRTHVAETAEDYDRLKPEGWEIAPLAAHRQRQVTAHGALGADPMAVMIKSAIREVFDEYDLSGGCDGGDWKGAGW